MKAQSNMFNNALILSGPQREKTCLRLFANNTGADQPAQTDQPLSYSLFGKYHMQTWQISIFKLVTVAEETGLKLALSETPKTGFLATRPKWSNA